MADTKLNQFVSRGTNAERLAYTPTPPTPASGPSQGYFFYETDTGNSYSWDGSAWDQVNATASAATTTEQLTGTDSTKRTTADSVAALWEQGADVASAGTTSLGEGGYFNITGTTTITDIDFATDKAGRKAWVKFVGILTLTHNASTLILPTGANIATAAGDTACFVSEGADAVRCVAYNRASGAALTGGASGAITASGYTQNTAKLLGRTTASNGAIEEIGVTAPLVLSGGALTTTAGVWTLQGAGQTVTGVYDQAVDGTKATIEFTGLSGTEVMIVCRNNTKSVSGVTAVRVSVNNGVSFYSASGDYILTSIAGVESNDTFAGAVHGTNTTAARSGVFRMLLNWIGGNPLPGETPTIGAANGRAFAASSSPINAIQVLGSAGGNISGGKIYCYTR